MDSLEKLETLQARILHRITELEISLYGQKLASVSLSSDDPTARAGDTMELRLTAILIVLGVDDFLFKRVPLDYYDRSLESRRDILGAPSIEHLCKSIVLVNTQAPASVTDCSDRNNSKYYVVVIQYMARLNAENIKNFVYALNDRKIPKKRFNFRLAPEEDSQELTGYGHNAVTCFGSKTNIPVILDEAITKLEPNFFWLGGGEVDLKLGIRTPQFITAIKPFIVSCST
ncbi:YbaK/aminoacyl-tRNA synthetase-associated domain-containing protein [Dioscorea alata]|uniref:YbaK/aminoacyl-tRNA synthetase-associated domain-containing protein n=1 Tax=Dioscorea alata TaxID=55571 RepID=A0ACB7UGK2_DIOAL|nr:YbaK/aminoacyl-tRNA synthetase-associated domain-containing protein [Dioscorea alata]